jgi:hypothetical protein
MFHDLLTCDGLIPIARILAYDVIGSGREGDSRGRSGGEGAALSIRPGGVKALPKRRSESIGEGLVKQEEHVALMMRVRKAWGGRYWWGPVAYLPK